MANESHLNRLMQETAAWNLWRRRNPDIKPDLSEVDLSEEDLSGADLSGANLAGAIFVKANLSKAQLSHASLIRADLSDSTLRRADIHQADLSEAILIESELSDADLRSASLSKTNLTKAYLNGANLTGANCNHAYMYRAQLVEAKLIEAQLAQADLREADLWKADLSRADLSRADLSGADLNATQLIGATLTDASLIHARLVQTNLANADLAGCKVYGISAWDLIVSHQTKQSNLIIGRPDQPTITVDNIEVAQFIYLILNNEKIRDVIQTITSKVVLILGRFTPERKLILDTLRDELRRRDYLPVLFDFDNPSGRTIRETVSTLAHLSRFVIADITSPRSIPQELEIIIPNLGVPIQPLLARDDAREYGMFPGYKIYPWVLKTHFYKDTDDLLSSLERKVIAPAEARAKQLEALKR